VGVEVAGVSLGEILGVVGWIGRWLVWHLESLTVWGPERNGLKSHDG
jgi:hypothetical protein